jgi:hypothetical protein
MEKIHFCCDNCIKSNDKHVKFVKCIEELKEVVSRNISTIVSHNDCFDCSDTILKNFSDTNLCRYESCFEIYDYDQIEAFGFYHIYRVCFLKYSCKLNQWTNLNKEEFFKIVKPGSLICNDNESTFPQYTFDILKLSYNIDFVLSTSHFSYYLLSAILMTKPAVK